MRDLVKDYLGKKVSRRSFINRATVAGFSFAAARSSLDALEPMVRAEVAQTVSLRDAAMQTDSLRYSLRQGTGGELLAEQIRATGTRFIFICNSSGMGPLCDAVVDRPDLQFIQGVSENQAIAMADGYAKASGQTSCACFSRVGGPIASANMYNAMKDRTPVVIVTDHMDSQADGRDGHEDLDDWLDAFKQYTKWRWLVKEGNRIPEWVAHAYKVSSTAPGGPTFVRIPRNVLYQNHKAGIFSRESISVPMDITANPKHVERAAQMLIEAKSPIMHVGHEVWTSGGRADVVELAELLAIPVVQAWSWAADFPTDHPLYLGGYLDPMRFPDPIDLFLNLGANLPDPGSSPTAIPRTAKIIHARVDSRQLGADYPVDLAIVAELDKGVSVFNIFNGLNPTLIAHVPTPGTAQRVAVSCPSFVADCLETVEEMGIRGRQTFIDAGGEELFLVPSLNAEAGWVEAVANWIREIRKR